MEVLREQYNKEIIPAMMKKFNYKSVMEVPKLDKIVINIGLGDTKENPKELENAMREYPSVTLFGPRQCGKTTLARELFPNYSYANLEDTQIRLLAQTDPEEFFAKYPSRSNLASLFFNTKSLKI